MTGGPESRRRDEAGASKSSHPIPGERFSAVVRTFDSVVAMLEFIDSNPSLWPENPDAQRSFVNEDDIEFAGTATWVEARALAENGWPDGERMLVLAASQAPPSVVYQIQTLIYDVAGAFPDVPRYIAGDVECMIDRAPSSRSRGRLLKVAIAQACHNSVSQKARANWGAALLSWIEAEELIGSVVQIDVAYLSEPTWYYLEDHKLGPEVVVKFRLKSADNQIAISELAYWLMHNSAHRRIQFAVRERIDVGRWFSKGWVYGRAVTELSRIAKYYDPDEIVLVMGNGAETVEDGLAAIYAAVAEWKKRSVLP